jgi:hypothetical protein
MCLAALLVAAAMAALPQPAAADNRFVMWPHGSEHRQHVRGGDTNASSAAQDASYGDYSAAQPDPRLTYGGRRLLGQRRVVHTHATAAAAAAASPISAASQPAGGLLRQLWGQSYHNTRAAAGRPRVGAAARTAPTPS